MNQITAIIISEVVTILFAIKSVKEEWAFTFPFREFNWPNGNKEVFSRIAHRSGAVGVAIVIGGLSIYPALCYGTDLTSWLILAGLTFCNLFWYWNVFDVGYAKSINEKWDYLGGSAQADGWLTKTFGRKAGRNKAYAGVIITVALHVIYFIFV